jgi:Domain of unknown function (DUF4129)
MRSLSLRSQLTGLLGAILLAALVGIASRPGGVGPGGPVPPREPLAFLLQTALYLGIAAEIVVLAAIAHALWPQGRRKRQPDEWEWVADEPEVHWAVKLLLLAVPTLMLAGVIAALIFFRQQGMSPHPAGVAPGVAPPPIPGSPGHPTSSGTGDHFLAWASLGMAGATIAAAWMAWFLVERRRRAWRQDRPRAARESLSDAIEESLEALRSDPDPRAAVIAAYSSMERAFARTGQPRRFFEAPLEFVGRVLASIPGATRDAEQLTDLFELARFSQHSVDEEMRELAVTALSRVRDQLLTPESP